MIELGWKQCGRYELNPAKPKLQKTITYSVDSQCLTHTLFKGLTDNGMCGNRQGSGMVNVGNGSWRS